MYRIQDFMRARGRPCLWAALWIESYFSLAIAQALMEPADTVYLARLAWAMAFSVVWGSVLGLLLAELPRRAAVILVSVAGVAVAVLGTFSCYHLLVYEQSLSVSSLHALMDSTVSEASEFLAETFTPLRWVIPLLFGAALLTIARQMHRALPARTVPGNVALRGLVAAASVATLAAMTWLGYYKLPFTFPVNNPLIFLYSTSSDVWLARRELAGIRFDTPAKSGAAADTKNLGSHILILGESVTPSHMSLYGYARDTTPRMRGDSTWQRFVGADVCSEQNLTAAALRSILTLPGNMPSLTFDLRQPNLISIAREAGFETFWISNQVRMGATYDNLSSAWSIFANHRQFLNVQVLGRGYGASLDGKLVPAVDAALGSSTRPKFMIVHMMGAHPDYRLRYPPGHAVWPDDEAAPQSVSRANRARYNQYDNAVRYTDHVVGEILQVAARHGVKSVTYLSDHGMNLGERSAHIGHSTDHGPRQGFEVPLAFWLDPQTPWLTQNRRRVFANNLREPYQTDRLLYTLLDLYDIRLDTPRRAESLFTEQYSAGLRRCDRMR